jgi:hypothetical protein
MGAEAASSGRWRRFAPWFQIVFLCLGFLLLSAWYFRRTFMAAKLAAIDLINFDMYTYVYPVLHHWFARVRSGELPLWNPFQACGTPLAATENGFFYPLNLLHLVLPTGAAIGYTAVLHFALAGLLQHQYLGSLGLAWPARLAGGLLFAFLPLLARYAWYPGQQNATVWIAAILWACEGVARRPRALQAGGLAAAIGLQLLAGRTQTVVYSWYVFLPYAIGRAVIEWRRDRVHGLRVVCCYGVGVLWGLALAAVQLVPQLELVRVSVRPSGGISRTAVEGFRGVTPIRELWETLLTLGTERLGMEASLPVYGWHMLALAALAVAARRRWLAWYFGVVLVVFFVLALGSQTALYDLYWWLPTGSAFRVPQRMLFLSLYALVTLAALGIDAAWRRPSAWLAMLPLAGALLMWWDTAAPTPIQTGLTVAFALGSSLVCLRQRWWRTLGALAVVIVLTAELFDLRPGPHAHPADRDRGYAVAEARTRERIRSELRPGMRVYYPFRPFEQVPLAKVGLFDGFPTVNDYEPLTQRRFAEFVTRLAGRPDDPIGAYVFFGEFEATETLTGRRVLDLMSVDLLVRRTRPSGRRLRSPALLEDGSRRLYRNPSAAPRAFLVSDYVVEADDDAALAHLQRPEFDWRKTAVVDRVPQPAPSPGPPGSVALLRDESEVVEVSVATSTTALLVLTDAHYRGWRATIDGRTAEILRANYLFRAVAVPPGSHVVTFEYRPQSFAWGAFLSVSAVLTLAITVGARVRRRKPAVLASP